MRVRRKVFFMAATLAVARPTAPQRLGKTWLSRAAEVRVLVRELLGAAPRPAVADGPVVEVDHLVGERAAVLDRQAGIAQARRPPDGVGVTEAAVDGPGIRVDEAHALMIGTGGVRHHRPAVEAEAPAIRHKGDTRGWALSCTR